LTFCAVGSQRHNLYQNWHDRGTDDRTTTTTNTNTTMYNTVTTQQERTVPRTVSPAPTPADDDAFVIDPKKPLRYAQSLMHRAQCQVRLR
jgi:hypothetical protein